MIVPDIPHKNGRTDACENSVVLKDQPLSKGFHEFLDVTLRGRIKEK